MLNKHKRAPTMETDIYEKIKYSINLLRKELVELRTQDLQLMRQFIAIDDKIKQLTPNRGYRSNFSKKFRIRRFLGCCSSNSLERYPNGTLIPLVRLQSVPGFCTMQESKENCGSMDSSSEYAVRKFIRLLSAPNICKQNDSASFQSSISCIPTRKFSSLNDIKEDILDPRPEGFDESPCSSILSETAIDDVYHYNRTHSADYLSSTFRSLDNDSRSMYEDILVTNIELWKCSCSTEYCLSSSRSSLLSVYDDDKSNYIDFNYS